MIFFIAYEKGFKFHTQPQMAHILVYILVTEITRNYYTLVFYIVLIFKNT